MSLSKSVHKLLFVAHPSTNVKFSRSDINCLEGNLIIFYPKEDFQILVDLGLSTLQAKVFIALVTRGTLKVKDISKVSKVSRPDVYKTLSKLQKLGLIEKEISKPYMFRAISIEIAVNILITKREKETKELEKESNFLLNKHQKNKQIISFQEESKFILVPSNRSLKLKLKQAIQRSKTSIDVITSSKKFNHACNSLTEPLEEAWKRKVKGRAIIERTEKRQTESFLKTWKHPWAGIWYISDTPKTIFAIYDKKEVFIFTEPDSELKDSPALWSNNSSLVHIANKYFEGLWNNPFICNLAIP